MPASSRWTISPFQNQRTAGESNPDCQCARLVPSHFSASSPLTSTLATPLPLARGPARRFAAAEPGGPADDPRAPRDAGRVDLHRQLDALDLRHDSEPPSDPGWIRTSGLHLVTVANTPGCSTGPQSGRQESNLPSLAYQ